MRSINEQGRNVNGAADGCFTSRRVTLDDAILVDTIRPDGIYHYIDMVRMRLKSQLSQSERRWFDARCKFREYEPKLPDLDFPYRLQVFQPTDDVLARLGRINHARLAFAELALDWAFGDDKSNSQACDLLYTFNVKKYHGEQHVVLYPGSTRYSGRRRAPNVLVIYPDRPSKVWGEIHTMHLEWRINSFKALCRAGIKSIADLTRIDHREFWRQRLYLCSIDADRLGRRIDQSRRQRSLTYTKDFGKGRLFEYNADRRRGELAFKHCGSTVQGVIDYYRRHFDLRRCLLPISVEHLLPIASRILASTYYD
jgi:hypothetical protein